MKKNNEICDLEFEIENKNKVIDLMAEWFEEWAEFMDKENYYTIFRGMSKEWIIEYYKNEVEKKRKE